MGQCQRFGKGNERDEISHHDRNNEGRRGPFESRGCHEHQRRASLIDFLSDRYNSQKPQGVEGYRVQLEGKPERSDSNAYLPIEEKTCCDSFLRSTLYPLRRMDLFQRNDGRHQACLSFDVSIYPYSGSILYCTRDLCDITALHYRSRAYTPRSTSTGGISPQRDLKIKKTALHNTSQDWPRIVEE